MKRVAFAYIYKLVDFDSVAEATKYYNDMRGKPTAKVKPPYQHYQSGESLWTVEVRVPYKDSIPTGW